jgi:excisionase family DNA binding protein
MPIQSPVRHSIPLAERPSGARGAAALRAATQADVRLVRADGTEEAFALPTSALPALADLLDRLSTADGVTVLTDDAEVTPEDAAGILGISRPLVRRRMDAGILPFRRVGSHRRIRLADVLALRAREEPVRKALEALAADSEDLERTYGL